MKKLLMVLAFAGVSVATMAQSETPVEKFPLSRLLSVSGSLQVSDFAQSSSWLL